MRARLCLLAALVLAAATEARAARDVRPLPAELLRRYAGTLPHGEIGLVESEADGRARQITLLGYAAAPPEVTRALVADPTLYPRYVRNLTRSEVEARPDGSLLNRWRLSYPIGSFDGTDEVRPLPGPLPGSGGAPGAVEVRSLGQGKEGLARWEFLPLPGGGTLVASYGYYDPLDNAILRAMIGKDPQLDAGFNLAGGLAVLRALLAEAGRLARGRGLQVAPPPALRPDFAPLLQRGTVAIVRTDGDGRLVDVSVLERVAVPLERLRHLVREPETWPSFLRFISRVRVTGRDPRGVDFQTTVAGPLFDVVTDNRTNYTDSGADTMTLSGMMRGARFRFDLTPDGPGATVALWRGNIRLADSSRLLRAMLRIEPSFEHSANISVGLVSVRAAAARALAGP